MQQLDGIVELLRQRKTEEAWNRCLAFISSPSAMVDRLGLATDSLEFSPKAYEQIGMLFSIISGISLSAGGQYIPVFRALLESVYYPYLGGLVAERKRAAEEALHISRESRGEPRGKENQDATTDAVATGQNPPQPKIDRMDAHGLACFHVALSTLSLLSEIAGISLDKVEDFIVSLYKTRREAARTTWMALRLQAGKTERQIEIEEQTLPFGFPIAEVIPLEELRVWSEFAVILLVSRGLLTLATPLERASPILPSFLDRLEAMPKQEREPALPVARMLLSLHSGCPDYSALSKRIKAL